MAQNRTVREALLDHSDSQACRRVWEAEQEGREADPKALLETLRTSEGELAVQGWDGAAHVYVRWDAEAEVYERLTCWPPATLAGFGRENRERALELLEDLRGLQPVLATDSPLERGPAAGLTEEWWL